MPYLLGRVAAIISETVKLPTSVICNAQSSPRSFFPYMFTRYNASRDKTHDEELREIFMDLSPDTESYPLRLTPEEQWQYIVGREHEIYELRKAQNRRKIAMAVKLKRIELGMTQSQLAEKIGITKQTVGNIESGSYNVSIDILSAVLSALGITLEI